MQSVNVAVMFLLTLEPSPGAQPWLFKAQRPERSLGKDCSGPECPHFSWALPSPGPGIWDFLERNPRPRGEMTCRDWHTARKGLGLAWNLHCKPQTYLLASLVQTESSWRTPARAQQSVPTPCPHIQCLSDARFALTTA